MKKLQSVAEARKPAAIGSNITIQGWIRTRRNSKAGFSFLEVNDGSCLKNLQVIGNADLPNYESEVKQLLAGCSVTVKRETWGMGESETTTPICRRSDKLDKKGLRP